jgi:hypothetical protein
MTSMWLYFIIGALAVVLAYLYWLETQQTDTETSVEEGKEGFYPGWYGGRWRRPGWGWRRPGWWGGGWGPYPYRPYPYRPYPYYPIY